MELLRRAHASDIATKNLIILDRVYSIAEALNILANFKILSAPVINRETGMIIGSIDVLDLLMFVLSVPIDTFDWYAKIKERFRLPIDNAVDYSYLDPFMPVLDITPLSDIVANLFSRGLHRVPLVDEFNQTSSIVAQADVVVWLDEQIKKGNSSELNKLSRQTLGQMDLVPGQVISVRDTCTLLLAFKSIIANNVSGVAIVNREGKLVGNLSATDFEGITEQNFLKLDKIVGEFIRPQPVLYVKRDTTFGQTLEWFREAKAHRFYIVDESFVPIGIVTLTDVMRIVTKELKLK